MSGGEQRRHCEKCDTHVHDLTGMSSKEIRALRKKNGDKLCGAFRLGASMGRPLALGSGIASLALASCAEKEVVLPGIVCPPPKKEESAKNREVSPSIVKSNEADQSSAKPINVDVKPVQLEVEQLQPMILGKLCPKALPVPKRDVGPI